MFTLDSVPSEIIDTILKYLPSHDLIKSCRGVNNTFKMLSEDKITEFKIETSKECDTELFKFLNNNFPNLRQIEIENYKLSFDDILYLSNCQKIERISPLPSLLPEQIVILFKMFPNYTELMLESDGAIKLDHVQNITNIKELYIMGTNTEITVIKSLVRNNRNISSLNLTHTFDETNYILNTFIENGETRIKELTLYGCFTDEDVMMNMFTLCPYLQT